MLDEQHISAAARVLAARHSRATLPGRAELDGERGSHRLSALTTERTCWYSGMTTDVGSRAAAW